MMWQRLKRMQQALKESKSNLAKASRIAYHASWDWNIATDDLKWSCEIHHIFDLRPYRFAATYWALAPSVYPDDREAIIKAVNNTVNQNQLQAVW